MKQTNKITLLILTGILSFGFMSNTAFGAAAQTAEQQLLDAACNGDAEAIRTLLAAGANVNTINNDGATALMAAAHNGHSNIVGQLIDAKANVNAVNNAGVTALMAAAHNGHNDIF